MPAIRNAILMILSHKNLARAAGRAGKESWPRDPARIVAHDGHRRREPELRRPSRRPPRRPTTRQPMRARTSRRRGFQGKGQAQGQEAGRRAQSDPPRPLLQLHHPMTTQSVQMNQQILSQDEVDALLQASPVKARSWSRSSRRQSGSQLRPGQPGADRSRAHAHDEIINERFARNIRIGLFNFIRKSPEISIGSIKVQNTALFCARSWCDELQHRQCSPAARFGTDRVRPTLVFAVIDLCSAAPANTTPHRGARLLTHRAAHHHPLGRRDQCGIQKACKASIR